MGAYLRPITGHVYRKYNFSCELSSLVLLQCMDLVLICFLVTSVVSLRERKELRLLCSGDKRTMDNGKIECANNVDRFVLFDGIMPL